MSLQKTSLPFVVVFAFADDLFPPPPPQAAERRTTAASVSERESRRLALRRIVIPFTSNSVRAGGQRAGANDATPSRGSGSTEAQARTQSVAGGRASRGPSRAPRRGRAQARNRADARPSRRGSRRRAPRRGVRPRLEPPPSHGTGAADGRSGRRGTRRPRVGRARHPLRRRQSRRE